MTETRDANSLIAELAKILGISEIDEPTLQLCVKLLDQGIDPGKLAESIKKINTETRSVMR